MEGRLSVAIRRYQDTDARDVFAIVRRGQKDADVRTYGRRRMEELSYHNEELRRYQHDPSTHMYVLTLHDPEDPKMERIEGCGAIALTKTGDGIGEITGISVLPEFQRLGLGRMLMETLEADARERKLTRLVLKAAEAAYGFYEILGFHDRDWGGSLLDNGYYPMEKELSL